MDDRGRRLLRAGIFLCLLALLTGLAMPAFTNPRMGMAAHVGGMMNGIFLFVAGLVWRELELSERWRRVAFVALVAGAYGNWASVVAAAAWGTRTLTPIAGAGFGAGRAQEAIVGAGLVAVGVATLAGTVALLVGLRRRR